MIEGSDGIGSAARPLAAGFRLSPQQKRLWHLRAASDAYRVRCVLAIEGCLDRARLALAVENVAKEHEILSADFLRRPRGRAPVQMPGASAPVWNEDLDLSPLSPEEQSAALEQLWDAFTEATSDWQHGSVLRLQLVRLNEVRSWLLLSLAPMCGDGASIPVLVQTIVAAYEGLRSWQDGSRERLQYWQYAQWQNDLLEAPDELLDEAKAFWSTVRLDSEGLILPVRRETPDAWSFVPGRISVTLDPELLAAVATGAAEHALSEAEFFFAAWCAFIWRWTRVQAPIGYISDGRTYDELRDVVGLLARCLPVECPVDGAMPFRTVAAAVQARLRESLEWQDYCLFTSTAPDESCVPGALAIGFEYEDRMAPIVASDSLWSIRHQEALLEPFELKLTCIRDGATTQAELAYDSGPYERQTAVRLLRSWLALLTDAALNPGRRLDRLAILDDEERAWIARVNETARSYPEARCFHELFQEQACRTPDAIAVRCGAAEMTYRELDERADGLAAHLSMSGVGPEGRVAIFLNRSPELVVAILGTLKAGGAYVPLDTSYPLDRLAQILGDSAPAMILTERGLADDLPAAFPPVFCVDTDISPAAAVERLAPARAHPENLAYVIYTSGSTGGPKGVMVPHRGLVNYVSWCLTAFDLSAGSGTLVHTPIGFDLTITGLLPPLLVGQAAILVPEAEGMEGLAEALQRERDLTLVKITPAHLEVLRNLLPAPAVCSCQVFVIGGEALRWDVLSDWRRRAPGARLVNAYGPTETVVASTAYDIAEGEEPGSSVPIGYPVANTQVYVLDTALQPVPTGMPGELYIGGAGVARGYSGRPDLTAEAFIPDPFGVASGGRLYKTGDVCRRLPDGNLEFLGRTDHQVKIRGYRIELSEIESVLARHSQVQDTVVVARGDGREETTLSAYVVTREGSVSTADLREHLREKLPNYMIPATFIFLGSLPLTPNGKLDRSALPLPHEADTPQTGECVGPRSPLEDALLGIWKEVLGFDDVGLDDDFFELGGHSLLATQVILRVREAFQVSAPLRWLFDAPNVAGFAALLLGDSEMGPRVQSLMDRMMTLQDLSNEELEERLRGMDSAAHTA